MMSLAEFSKKGVFLCDCHSSMSKVLPMEALCQFLEQMQPGLPVVVGDNFCQPQILSRLAQEHSLQPVVVGACWQLNSKLPFREEPEGVALDPYSVRIVDLLQEIASPYNNVELMERVKLLLWSQVRRQARFSSMPQQSRKLHFIRPQGEISRRDLFRLPLPRYQVIPCIQIEKCVGGERCHLCQEGCPFKAMVSENNQVLIDKLRCQGCGACVAACPFQAICYPAFSLDQLEGEMEGLLLANGDMLQPRIAVLICRSCLPFFGEAKANPISYASNMFPLEVPCLSMVPTWLLLRAFDLGAQGVALISNTEKCQFGLKPDKWQGKVRFVQELFERWGIEPGRIRAFEGSRLEQELTQFAQGVAQLPPTSLRSSQPTKVPANALPLPALIAGLAEKLAPCSSGVVSAGTVPFGKLELDRSQCTACGLCALDCPTEALRFVSDKEAYQLLFHYQACIGCGQCVRSCPEKCLHLENTLEIERLNKPAETVLEGEIARCQECGIPIAPRAMIDKLRTRIAAAQGLTSQLSICPACRIKAMSGVVSSMGA
jgi:ferredoxin